MTRRSTPKQRTERLRAASDSGLLTLSSHLLTIEHTDASQVPTQSLANGSTGCMAKYIIKRVLYMIPTLFVISLISFTIIQLPPGDFLTSYVAQLRSQGEDLDAQAIQALQDQYGLNQPIYVQYGKWITNIVTRGDFGLSFEWRRPVSELIWDRLGLTVFISLLTIIVTWIDGDSGRRVCRDASVLVPRLSDELYQLHRPGHAGVPGGAGVSLVYAVGVQCERRRPVLATVHRRAWSPGEVSGYDGAHLGAGIDPGAGEHRRHHPHRAGQPARRAEQAVCRDGARQRAEGARVDLEVPGAGRRSTRFSAPSAGRWRRWFRARRWWRWC